jgi:hypothetical protein
VIEHYDSQDHDERAAEIEAAWEAKGMMLMSVPTELVPEIRAIIARKQTASLRAAAGPAHRGAGCQGLCNPWPTAMADESVPFLAFMAT